MSETKEIQYKPYKRITEGKSYWIELIVLGKAIRIPARQIYSLEGLIGLCSVIVSTNYPNVQGFNILSEDQETLLHEVHPTGLLIAAAPIIQQITGQQPLRAAVPVISSANGENLQKMIDDARTKGRLIQ